VWLQVKQKCVEGGFSTYLVVRPGVVRSCVMGPVHCVKVVARLSGFKWWGGGG
jgi:hypothetical protein